MTLSSLPPTISPPTLAQIDAWLQEQFSDVDYEVSVPLHWCGFSPNWEAQRACHIAIALDGSIRFEDRFDALIVHRPFHLPDLACNRPVFAIHAAFDRTFTPGHSQRFADALQARQIADLSRVGRVGKVESIGWLGEFAVPVTWEEWLNRLIEEVEQIEGVTGEAIPEKVHRIAVVEAMTPQTIRNAMQAGAQVYVTG